MAENPDTPPSPELTEYESTFMCNSDRFLSTYQNSLATAWSSTDVFFINFKKVDMPSELYYRLWLFVAKIRVTIMASYALINGKGPKPFSQDGATIAYTVSEMIFLSEAMGHVGRALNILIVMREARPEWRDYHGPQYDLAADMLSAQLDKSVGDWATRTANVFGLATFDREGMFARINHELLHMKMALYVEHGCLYARELRSRVQAYWTERNTDNWDFRDLCSYIVHAREVAIALKTRGEEVSDPRWIKFCDLVHKIKTDFPDFLEEKKISLDISTLDEHSLLHVSSTLRMVIFYEFDQFLVRSRTKIELVPGFKFKGFPLNGLPLLGGLVNLPEGNHFVTLGVPKIYDQFIHIGPGEVDKTSITEYRFYAAMKSPIHLMALYGGLLFMSSTDTNTEEATAVVFDRGAEILFEHPIPLTMRTNYGSSVFMPQTQDFQLTKEKTSMRSEIPDFWPPEILHVREADKTSLLPVLCLLTLPRPSTPYGSINEGFTLWRLCCLEPSSRGNKAWKSESLMGKFVMLSEQSRQDWILKNTFFRPKLLACYKTMLNLIADPEFDDVAS